LKYLQGLMVWLGALLLAWTLPGSLWKAAPAPGFPFHALLPTFLALLLLTLFAIYGAWCLGPRAAETRPISLLEALPEILWASLLLALWPSHWGAPGLPGWLLAFLAAGIFTEIRWLAQALPKESPFPKAWGRKALLQARRKSLLHLMRPWLASRLPLWLTSALVLERVFGVQGLGSDWTLRVISRDHGGLSVWIILLAALWFLSRPLEPELHP
jgi:hypothetical protein